MSRNNYISLEIDGVKADIDPEGQVPTVSYQLENEEDFEQKKSAEILNLELPGTEINDQIHNTLHNPSVIDNTTDQVYDNFRPMRYIANGDEIFLGKYLPQFAIKVNGRVEKYNGKAYGLNGDWVIDMKEKTLFDFVNPRTHIFDVNTIIASWGFDGRNEATDYVYAPVRYRKPFGEYPAATEDNPDPQPLDDNVLIDDMKVSISIYWLLWRGFKSLGYRLVSQFMDTDYYRRSLLTWTWGGFNFLDDSRWEPLKFMAAQPPIDQVPNHAGVWTNGDYDGYPDLQVIIGPTAAGTFTNNPGTFEYTTGASPLSFMMVWHYNAVNLGNVRVGLSVILSYFMSVANNSDIDIRVQWYKNGTLILDEPVDGVSAPTLGSRTKTEFGKELFFETDVSFGDYVGVRVKLHQFESGTGGADSTIDVESFQINYVKLGPGSTVDLKNNYPKFKNYKWMDLLRGEIDMFDLLIQTDPIRKEVHIEPAHTYDINGTPYPGYYNRKQLDWSQKIDISKRSTFELFSDYERELVFKFRDDTNDGGLKKVQDRNQTTIGLAKYVLPERYKAEKKERENRFYSPVMHCKLETFKYITGTAPQLIAIIPENISNTSSSESENTYNPKRVWYKGNITGFGGWKFNGITYTALPYMFAVNYQPGGVNDPVLSYSDQIISGVIAKGLLKKFFLQRMAILRNGRRYVPINVMLNNYDIGNFLHRESIIIENIEYLLTSIKDYNPMKPKESTACNMWMFMPVSTRDADNSYPSIQSIQAGGIQSSYDVKYWQHLLLTSDIPT
jgi:hypothetical protein